MPTRPKASPETLSKIGRRSAVIRHTPNADTTDLERDIAASQLVDYARHVVDTAPPLTDDQVNRVVALLRGGASR